MMDDVAILLMLWGAVVFVVFRIREYLCDHAAAHAPRWAVAEVFEDGTLDILGRFDDEAAALACRRDLQDRVDRLPPPEPTVKPEPRKRHAGRWVDGPVVAVIAGMAAWGDPAAAQHSPLYEPAIGAGRLVGGNDASGVPARSPRLAGHLRADAPRRGLPAGGGGGGQRGRGIQGRAAAMRRFLLAAASDPLPVSPSGRHVSCPPTHPHHEKSISTQSARCSSMCDGWRAVWMRGVSGE